MSLNKILLSLTYRNLTNEPRVGEWRKRENMLVLSIQIVPTASGHSLFEVYNYCRLMFALQLVVALQVLAMPNVFVLLLIISKNTESDCSRKCLRISDYYKEVENEIKNKERCPSPNQSTCHTCDGRLAVISNIFDEFALCNEFEFEFGNEQRIEQIFEADFSIRIVFHFRQKRTKHMMRRNPDGFKCGEALSKLRGKILWKKSLPWTVRTANDFGTVFLVETIKLQPT